MKEEKELEVKKPKKVRKPGIIIPLKDFRIKFNEIDIQLKKGIEIEVPEMFLVNLKTEKVIN